MTCGDLLLGPHVCQKISIEKFTLVDSELNFKLHERLMF